MPNEKKGNEEHGVRLSYKFRIYPTPSQCEAIKANIDASRFVYNHYLRARMDAYERTQQEVRKMVDDDKRRETARRLRAAAEQADPAVGVSELEIFCILDVDMGGERGFADMQDVLRLADLIDRPARQGSEKGDER